MVKNAREVFRLETSFLGLMTHYAAIEAGGTTWVAALVAVNGDLAALEERIEVPTTAPAETISKIKAWLSSHVTKVCAIGVASFGPIDPKPSSSTFGFITSTPKPGWKNTDVVGLLGLRDEFMHIPFKFDTDVNAPAIAEYTMYAPPGSTSSAYVTVGTGVGVGLVINGKSVHGMLHPEGGHLQVKRMPGDTFEGSCPFHGDCIEGMVSTGALAARTGLPASELPSLPDGHEVWDAVAYYLAQLSCSLILLCSPEQIVFGGGVFNREILYAKIRAKTRDLLRDYIQHTSILQDESLETLICPSHWGQKAGIVGAVFLAKLAGEAHS